MRRRVVITGVGMITPLGGGLEAQWTGLMDGRSGISKITRFDTSEFSVKIAGEVSDFDPQRWMSKREARRMDRFIQLREPILLLYQMQMVVIASLQLT